MEHRELKGWDIEIFKLQNKSYDFDFAVDDSFFQAFDDSLISKGKAAVKTTLKKSETFIEVNIQIDGIVELICDRSLENFDYPLSVGQDLIFKFGEEEKELDDFMMQITKNTTHINLAQFIYEFISLSIPMKKLHPRFMNLDEAQEEDGLIYSSDNKAADNQADEASPGNDDGIDPRWKKLIELKNTKQ